MKNMEFMEELCLNFSSSNEIHYEDLRCEFDAPRYYDFSRPETSLESQEAERWFNFAATCPPSPFIAKLKLDNNGIDQKISTFMNDQEHVNSICRETDHRTESVASTSYNNGVEETRKVGKEKHHAAARVRSSSTLMKPTASYLAKQRQRPLDTNLNRLLLRNRKSHAKDENIMSARSSINHIPDKRQKIEAASYNMHKAAATKASRHNKVTVPREPVVETSRRAQRRRSKNSDESVVSTKPSLQVHPFSNAPPHFSRKFDS